MTAARIPAIQGCQEDFCRWTTVCYYPTTLTDYPSTTRGTSVGHPVAVNINICGNLRFLSITFVYLYEYSTPLTTFWSRKSFCFIGQCWYVNPQWTPEWVIIKACSVSQLGKMHVYEMSTYISVFVEGLWRWRRYILAPKWKLDLQGSCTIASHSS